MEVGVTCGGGRAAPGMVRTGAESGPRRRCVGYVEDTRAVDAPSTGVLPDVSTGGDTALFERAGGRSSAEAATCLRAQGRQAARGPYPFAEASAMAFAQSALNCSMPRSVSGWWTIWRSTLKGIVAMCAPASAASVTWRGWRTEAVMISAS